MTRNSLRTGGDGKWSVGPEEILVPAKFDLNVLLFNGVVSSSLLRHIFNISEIKTSQNQR